MVNNLLYQKSWKNQTIDGKLVNNVRVRIFKSPIDVISDNYEKVVATDGQTFQKSRHTSRKHTKNHSYVVLSTGLYEKFSGNLHLYIKLYLTDNFTISCLKDADFLGKIYVVETIEKYLNNEEDIPLSPLQNYLRKKVGNNYAELYSTLITAAQESHFNLVQQLFKTYKISTKFQALFWKELYRQTAKTKQ